MPRPRLDPRCRKLHYTRCCFIQYNLIAPSIHFFSAKRQGTRNRVHSCLMYRKFTASWPRCVWAMLAMSPSFLIAQYPPASHATRASPHSTVHRAGASSLATFKYAVIPYRGHYSSVAPTPILSDHDSKAIQDTLEGLRLMSLLKCVHFLFLLIAVLPMLNSRVPPTCPSSPALPLPAIQTRLWTRRSPASPENQLAGHRDPRLHAP